MSLQYNILWLDDRIEEYQTLEIDTELEDYIESLFFEPHLYMYESVDEAVQNSTKRKYDVIFSDFNINENKTGKDFIFDIRNKNVNAEVLFYSAQQTPPETGLDRISFLRLHSDISYEDLKNKMKSVINLTIEKLKDLTNLRGLVMSEVSELDVMMKDIVADYCKKSETDEKELRGYIIGTIEERVKKTLDLSQSNCDKKCFHEWKNKTVQEVVFEQNFDSYTTARALNHIIEKKKFSIEKFLSNYNSEIIKNRNELAHCKTMQKNDGSEVLVTNKGEKEFTAELINDIRKNIIKYHKIFDIIEERIGSLI